jgi:hypothetical protein
MPKKKDNGKVRKQVSIRMTVELEAIALMDRAMDLVHGCTRNRVLAYTIAKHLGSVDKINRFVLIKTGSVSEGGG